MEVTRDAVDVPFEVETDGVRQKYVLIDTAGIRKTRRVSDSIEYFSVKRSGESIERCDMAVLVALCDGLSLAIIEDCAHTMGAKWNDMASGRDGAVVCYSTQNYKHLLSGEVRLIKIDDP